MPRVTRLKPLVGTINDVPFYDQALLNTVAQTLALIETRFGECYNHEFIQDLSYVTEQVHLKCDTSYVDIGEDLCEDILYSADDFASLELDFFGSREANFLNEKLREGAYTTLD